jgi:NADPH:quinone reductase-like Zn-dependent oxidoreductase
VKAYLVKKYKRPIQAADVPEPTVGDHDLLVDIQAAGVNLIDAKVRDAQFKVFLPYKRHSSSATTSLAS